jgi:hypothetical protein
MRWAGHVAHMGVERKLYSVLVGKVEGKRLLGRPRCRWEEGIRMDIWEIGWGARSGFDWLRIWNMAGSCERDDEPSCSGYKELVIKQRV